MITAVIEVRNTTKYFVTERPLYKQLLNPFASGKSICALDKISFRVDPGEILGVVGPNGAGKTTLLRIMADVLRPDSGEVIIDGCEVNGSRRNMRSNIGYVSSDERSFFWRLTGRQNLEFFTGLYGMPNRMIRSEITKLLDEFDLTNKSRYLFRDYSAGTRKKFAIIRAMAHQPRVLLLDEVTNSLDPQSAEQAKTMVRDYIDRQTGSACIWSTHRLEEIAQICDKVLVIEAGRMKSFETISKSRQKEISKDRYLQQVHSVY